VDLQKMGLSETDTDKVSAAIQRAVMSEIATLDVAPAFGVELVRPELPGQLKGLAIAPLER
jgi:hypothetical protein